ncbi:MAG: lectin-like protein [Planctomycetota bacterium]
MQHARFIAPLTCLALAGGALAQGADDCAMATPIVGPGPHAFDNTGATDSGVFPTCVNVAQDVWFAWTAPATGPYIMQTCGNAGIDTAAAIYDGTCAGPELGCNDDACGLQTSISFDAIGGQVYLIQMGTFSAAGAGAGAFTITLDAPIFNPANGSYYRLINGTLDWLSASAAAQASTWMGTAGHLATIADQAELDFILQNVSPSRPWIGLFQNTSSPSYSEPGSGWEWVTGEPLTFTNWAPGEPNNISASGGPEDYCEMFGNGQWNDAELNHSFTNQYLIEYSNTGIGTSYCSPAVNNSTGGPASIGASGSVVVADNDLTLEASGLPINSFGFFLTSVTQATVPMPGGSQGTLCLGGAIGRYVAAGQIKNSGAQGEFSLLLNLTQTPTPNGLIAVQAGQSRNFQAWYRDAVNGTATSNFTDGLSVTFQ